ncbi:MAG: hypothetical protein FJ403_21065 [Verrucomicrobia bacterium]|nr:hypothetical protein [Verrucomicrobiota bacterium]
MTVTVPAHIKANQIAEIILMVREQPVDYTNKVQAMKAAAIDELFLQDLNEVSSDFQSVDADWPSSS